MKLLQKLLKRFVQLCLLVPVLLILKFNWTLYFSPTCEQKINLDVLNQLNHLEKAIKKDEVDFKMQNLFPEGYFFTNVLYGLAWADLIETVDKENPVFQRGILEIEYSIAKLNSEEGKAIFSPKSPLPYGTFYNGWLTYLVGNYIETVGEKKANQLKLPTPPPFFYRFITTIFSVTPSNKSISHGQLITQIIFFFKHFY